MPTSEPESESFSLHLEEYQALRTEISDLQKQRFTTAQVGIAGIVAIWSFQARLDACTSITVFTLLGWCLPVFVAFGCWRLTKHASLSIRHGATYLAMIEQIYALAELGGWHNRSARINAAKRRAEDKDKSASEIGDPDPNAALKALAPYPPAESTEIRALNDLMEERSTTPRVSNTLETTWKIILYITLVIALFAIGVILLFGSAACTAPDAQVFPALTH